MNPGITVIYYMITAHRIINLLSKSIYLSYIRDDGSHFCLAAYVSYWSSLSRLSLVYMVFCLLTLNPNRRDALLDPHLPI